MIKSLLFGSAAGLVAMGGAQAADLPLKAKAVEYVKICSLYGAGFYYIPGTDTCIKLGGYLRVETALWTTATMVAPITVSGCGEPPEQPLPGSSRGDFNIDTRTATEYGVVRTFFDAVFTWTSGTYEYRHQLGYLVRRVMASRAVRSASTSRSSSSPVSRWVRRSPSSMRLGPTIRPTTSTAWSAAATRLRCQPVQLYCAVR